GCDQGAALQLLQVQPEGKKPISAREFLSGYRLAAGERLG
ncbi:MAG TPA: methionyl-tRNA formyltransferase, partial [Candidatus Angelobacter sp.]